MDPQPVIPKLSHVPVLNKPYGCLRTGANAVSPGIPQLEDISQSLWMQLEDRLLCFVEDHVCDIRKVNHCG